MSATMYVEFRGCGFWAWDVGTGIFLKHLADAAELRRETDDWTWLQYCAKQWRFNAVIADCGLHLDENWSEEQLQVVISLIEDACGVLRLRATIPADEMMAWDLFHGEGVFPRSDDPFPTSSAIQLGQAILQLLTETHPPGPEEGWWLYGTPDGRRTMAKRTE